MFDRYLVFAYRLRELRAETFYLVREIQSDHPADVYRAVMFFQYGPYRVLAASGVVVETPVRVFRLVVLYVPYALLHRGRNHVFVQILRIVPVPGISEQMAGYQLEVFADLRRRLAGLLAFLELFR